MKLNFECEKVTSIETYLHQLPELNEKLKGNIFYRGQSRVSYNLTPSVFRDGLWQEEQNIYTQIMTECAHEFEDCILHNEKLSKMQHYGVPTRLLDVTTNALVALYFACERNEDEDGAVFVIKTDNSKIKQYDSDAISIISSLPRFKYEEKEAILDLAISAQLESQMNSADETIKKFNENKIIKRLLHEIKKEKPAFENIINPEDILTNYFFLPRKVNARIIRQSGAFIIFGLKDREIEIKDPFSPQHNHKSYKIIVGKEYKKSIINQLSIFGITKATLHPELYKVAEFIKDKYHLSN
ncbi:FRG domain-containing protein [Bacillus sp. USDA818B3_A]|uniref:FRG domain-containing protein n=1 Tax=Bacillus sp. USDA818B3_A TaxID=2698834 RepID=UPI001369E870|nr:FRG domain-containing protein [Bacillus sp. USDA818B3_A]